MNIRIFSLFFSVLLIPLAIAGSFQAPNAGHARFEITELRPGLPFVGVEAYLDEKGIRGPLKRPNYNQYETPVFPFFLQRQRLVLLHSNQQLVKTAVIIDFEAVGDRRSDEQVFLQVLNRLMGRYGAPHRQYERGNFRPDLVNQVRTRRFSRIYEWQFQTGVLRFGIPERLDRRVRMELHFAKSFPTLSNARWGLDRIF